MGVGVSDLVRSRQVLLRKSFQLPFSHLEGDTLPGTQSVTPQEARGGTQGASSRPHAGPRPLSLGLAVARQETPTTKVS